MPNDVELTPAPASAAGDDRFAPGELPPGLADRYQTRRVNGVWRAEEIETGRVIWTGDEEITRKITRELNRIRRRV